MTIRQLMLKWLLSDNTVRDVIEDSIMAQYRFANSEQPLIDALNILGQYKCNLDVPLWTIL